MRLRRAAAAAVLVALAVAGAPRAGEGAAAEAVADPNKAANDQAWAEWRRKTSEEVEKKKEEEREDKANPRGDGDETFVVPVKEEAPTGQLYSALNPAPDFPAITTANQVLGNRPLYAQVGLGVGLGSAAQILRRHKAWQARDAADNPDSGTPSGP